MRWRIYRSGAAAGRGVQRCYTDGIAKGYNDWACGRGGMADALDLGSSLAKGVGSSPTVRIEIEKELELLPQT